MDRKAIKKLFGLVMHGVVFLLPMKSACAASTIKHLIVIVMENKDAKNVYGNKAEAPFINKVVLPKYAYATNFEDELPGLDSEPHYLWMEAGTNKFADHSFTTDGAPSKSNSTASREHLSAQLNDAHISWMSYQEGQNASTGACPIVGSGHYAPKHNPFVFFKDISGNPPRKDSAECVAHSRPYSSFATDLASNSLARYVFITPDLCHDMHDRCGGNRIRNGDDWLKAELPRMIDWVTKNEGVIFVTWDESGSTNRLPFLAIGPSVKPNYASPAKVDHGSMLKSIEKIFGLPDLATVSGKPDLSDLFQPGRYP
jgi:phosphatidylinositol-3-phosphatase